MRGLYFTWGRVRVGVLVRPESWGWRASVVVKIDDERAPAGLSRGVFALERGARQLGVG